jgi:hypothetical protein
MGMLCSVFVMAVIILYPKESQSSPRMERNIAKSVFVMIAQLHSTQNKDSMRKMARISVLLVTIKGTKANLQATIIPPIRTNINTHILIHILILTAILIHKTKAMIKEDVNRVQSPSTMLTKNTQRWESTQINIVTLVKMV